MAKNSSGSSPRGKLRRVSEAEVRQYQRSDAFRREIEALAARPEDQIDLSEIPERIPQPWDRPVRTSRLFYRPLKKPVTIRLDADVIEWLKSDGPGYQTKANRILRYQMCAEEYYRERHLESKREQRKPAVKNGKRVTKAERNGKSRHRA